MRTAEEQGKDTARLKGEEFKASRDSFVKWTEAEIRKRIAIIKLYLAFLLQELNKLSQELSQRGDVPEGVSIENIFRCLFLMLLLSASVGGKLTCFFGLSGI